MTKPGPVRHVAHVMGMPVSLALRGRHARDAAGARAWEGVTRWLEHVDTTFSTYRPDSAVSRIDRGDLSIADAPAEVREVLALAERADRATDGWFSVWLPGEGSRRRLDPSGLVKGWAVDRAAAHLAALDGTDYCLSAGGDLVCRTLDAASEPWRIGIEDPHDRSRLVATVPVGTGAVATSGTAHRGQHLVDGRTGLAPDGVASVTVVTASLTWADIDATAAYAQGPDAARWLGTRPGRTGVVVWADGSTTLVG